MTTTSDTQPSWITSIIGILWFMSAASPRHMMLAPLREMATLEVGGKYNRLKRVHFIGKLTELMVIYSQAFIGCSSFHQYSFFFLIPDK